MADLTSIQRSRSVQITDETEQYAVDVVREQGKDKLLAKAESSISADLRIIQEYDQDVELDDVNYYTIYSDTGNITCSGFMLKFDDDKVWVKLEIDGNTIFDIDVEKFKDMSDLNDFTQPDTYLAWNDKSETFFFTPSFPIIGTSSITISARSQTGDATTYEASILQVS